MLQNNRNRIDNNSADLISEQTIDEGMAVITEEKPGVRQNKPPHHFPHDFSKPLKSKQFLLCLPRVNASVFHADEYICDCNHVCLQAEISEDLQMTYTVDFDDEEGEWEEYEEEESYEEFEEFSTDEEYEGKNQDDSATHAVTAAANKVAAERLAKEAAEAKTEAEAFLKEQLRAGLRHEPHLLLYWLCPFVSACTHPCVLQLYRCINVRCNCIDALTD